MSHQLSRCPNTLLIIITAGVECRLWHDSAAVRMPQGQDIFMSLFAVDLLAASTRLCLLLQYDCWHLLQWFAASVDPAEEHGHFCSTPP